MDLIWQIRFRAPGTRSMYLRFSIDGVAARRSEIRRSYRLKHNMKAVPNTSFSAKQRMQLVTINVAAEIENSRARLRPSPLLSIISTMCFRLSSMKCTIFYSVFMYIPLLRQFHWLPVIYLLQVKILTVNFNALY